MLKGMLETGCLGFKVSLALLFCASASLALVFEVVPFSAGEEEVGEAVVSCDFLSRGLLESTDARVLALASMMEVLGRCVLGNGIFFFGI